jgi:hypothetical protein
VTILDSVPTWELIMRHAKPVPLALAALLLAASAQAQTAPDPNAEVKTLKERLSDKASDEQRVDNCRVPPDKQGTTPRPGCTTPPVATATKPP